MPPSPNDLQTNETLHKKLNQDCFFFSFLFFFVYTVFSFELFYIVISGPFITDCMRYGLWSLLKAVRWPIVVSFCVIWSFVESCLIGNHTTSSFLYKQRKLHQKTGVRRFCSDWVTMYRSWFSWQVKFRPQVAI